MTNLKNVYGIISFEETNIKISVFLVCKQKQHCMYHRNIILPESLSDFLKNNRNDLIQYLQKELIKVDNFIGIKVLRYLILVPHLNMTVSNHLTDELNCANQEELNKYLNNIIIPENKVCLSHVITDYVVNEQVQLHFPQKQKFKANYIEYLADKNDIKDICELISSLCIEPLGFYNNAIAYQASLLNHEKKTRMLIDMQDDLSNVYLYDKNADLYCLKTIIRGKNWFINKLSQSINLDRNKTIELISSFKNLKLIDRNIALINYHKPNYRSVKQLDSNFLKKIINSLVNEYFEEIVKQLKNIDADSIHFNCDMQLYDCFDFKLNKYAPVKINNVTVETQKQNILGLEDENVSNIVWILNGVINLNEICKKEIPCSIDAYVDEHQMLKQFNQNMFVKFGLFLTNVVAKLGNQGDQVWKKS